MSNLSVKHSRSFSPAKLRRRAYARAPGPAKFCPGYKDERLSRNPCHTEKNTIEKIVEAVRNASLDSPKTMCSELLSQCYPTERSTCKPPGPCPRRHLRATTIILAMCCFCFGRLILFTSWTSAYPINSRFFFSTCVLSAQKLVSSLFWPYMK